jgi:hypothetical protein
VRELADITERLSALKKGSNEYVRLVQTMASLDEALRASRAMQEKQLPSNVADLSHEELIARLEQLLADARASKPVATPASEPRSDQSEVASGTFSAPPVVLPAEKESASPSLGLIRSSPPDKSTSSPIELSEEERERVGKQIRRERGWDKGVLNQTTGLWRYRE